jgi:hypothetical protein
VSAPVVGSVRLPFSKVIFLMRELTTVKFVELVPVPAELVTPMGPVVAALGTLAVICVSEFTENDAGVPLKVTCRAAVKADPEIVTEVPAVPLVGEKEVIVGAVPPVEPVTVKLPVLVAVPAAFVTLRGPVVAPLGTVAAICALETIEKTATVPLNFTAEVPANPVPLIVTDVPTAPLVGLNELMVGCTITVKSCEEVAVPLGVVTLIFPVVEPLGTLVVICVLEFTVKVAEVVLKATAVAPAKLIPVMTTEVLTIPLVGVNEVTAGAAVTVKLLELVPVPAEFVTATFPVVAPVGTVAVTWVLEFTVKVVAAVPLKVTSVVPVKPLPEIATLVPTGPLVGVKELTVGVAVTVKLKRLVPVPAAFVTLRGPLVAPAGTVAVV